MEERGAVAKIKRKEEGREGKRRKGKKREIILALKSPWLPPLSSSIFFNFTKLLNIFFGFAIKLTSFC